MRFKKNTFLITLAAVLCMAAFPFSASANIDEDYDYDYDEEISVNDNVESKTPLTPSGKLTVIDDVHQTTDEDAIEDKQFITVQSKSGNTFYIIIDRSGDTENVYFLNAVDEADLLALTEDADTPSAPASCTCTVKCETGAVNTECAVCSVNKDDCLAVSSVASSADATEAPAEGETPAQEQNNSMPLIGFIVIVLVGGGAALYWFKFKNKKPSTKGTTDPNDLFEADEDYDEETEVEADDEADYETEDENDELSDDETDSEIVESEVE